MRFTGRKDRIMLADFESNPIDSCWRTAVLARGGAVGQRRLFRRRHGRLHRAAISVLLLAGVPIRAPA